MFVLKKKAMRRSRDIDIVTILCLVAACIGLFALAHALQGTNPFTPSNYNTYTLQALQWRKGKIALEHDYSYLELAIYQSEYFVSFPPVPTIPIFFLTFLFGNGVPDALLVQGYAIMACLTVYRVLRRENSSYTRCATWAFLLCFASSLLPLLQDGAVWYQAQVLCFLLTVLAVERMQNGSPTAALFMFALSVGCRPFQVIYGPLLIAYGIQRSGQPAGMTLKKMLPGLLLGLCVAIAYGVYNYIRFGNIFEFGHSYLPEFSTEGGIQFSIRHILKNAQTFVLGLPFEVKQGDAVMNKFGFSLFLANPIFLCFHIWLICDAAKHRMKWFHVAVYCTFVMHAMLLLSHRTCGGFQYGARYFIDCIPYVLIYLATHNSGLLRKSYVEIILLICGLLLGIYGAHHIHI